MIVGNIVQNERTDFHEIFQEMFETTQEIIS